MDIDEKKIKEITDKIKEEKLDKLGYVYVNIDDGWNDLKGRDEDGNLIYDKNKFPNGIKALSDYIHDKGLKFGIYSDVLEKTCGNYPASLYHYERDAKLFSSWNVDYIKIDWGDNEEGLDPYTLYKLFGYSLKEYNPNIFYSICHWGQNTHSWVSMTNGDMIRTTYDLIDIWDSPYDSNRGNGILSAWDQNESLCEIGGTYIKNPDMLVVGLNEGINQKKRGPYVNPPTLKEYESHFILWCIKSSPLILGSDIRKLSEDELNIIKNKDLIDINQNPMVIPDKKKNKKEELEIYVKPLLNNEYAVLYFNRGEDKIMIDSKFDIIGLKGNYWGKDLVLKNEFDSIEKEMIEIDKHETKIFKVKRSK